MNELLASEITRLSAELERVKGRAMQEKIERAIRSLTLANSASVQENVRKLVSGALDELAVAASYVGGCSENVQRLRAQVSQTESFLADQKAYNAILEKQLAEAQAARNAATAECQSVREVLAESRKCTNELRDRLGDWLLWANRLSGASTDEGLRQHIIAKLDGKVWCEWMTKLSGEAVTSPEKAAELREWMTKRNQELIDWRAWAGGMSSAGSDGGMRADLTKRLVDDSAHQRLGAWQRWVMIQFPETKRWFTAPVEDFGLAEMNARNDAVAYIRNLNRGPQALASSQRDDAAPQLVDWRRWAKLLLGVTVQSEILDADLRRGLAALIRGNSQPQLNAWRTWAEQMVPQSVKSNASTAPSELREAIAEQWQELTQELSKWREWAKRIAPSAVEYYDGWIRDEVTAKLNENAGKIAKIRGIVG